MNLTSLNCATLSCGKRSSSASVWVRSCNDPRASSAMMKGWITMCPWLRRLPISLFVDRRWSIQIEVSVGHRYSILRNAAVPAEVRSWRSIARRVPAFPFQNAGRHQFLIGPGITPPGSEGGWVWALRLMESAEKRRPPLRYHHREPSRKDYRSRLWLALLLALVHQGKGTKMDKRNRATSGPNRRKSAQA